MKLIRFNAILLGAFLFSISGCTSDVNPEITNAYVEKSGNIVIQYTYDSNDTELSSQFDITPDFTLYGDGRLIYGEPLVFPMYYSMPGLPGGPIMVYQPSYQLNDMMLSKEEVVEFIDYLNSRGFLKLNQLWDNNPSYNGKNTVTMNLKCGKNTVVAIGDSAPQELAEIINHLREFMDMTGRAKVYDFQKMAITCEISNFPFTYVPTWNFPTIDLDSLAGSVDGMVLEGQLKVDILDALTTKGRFFDYNGNTYVIYYKPLMPY